MSLLPVSVLIVAAVSILVAAAVALAAPWLVGALSGVEPRARARWVFALLAAPFLSGSGVLFLALGHCVASRALGVPEDCDGPVGRGCVLCLYGDGEVVRPAAWAFAVLCAVPLARSLYRAVRGVWRARRARRAMELAAERSASGVLVVPGANAFVLGWPESVVFVGDELSRGLSPEGVAAVTAHEHEHLRRGDVTLRMLSRALASTHLPRARQCLLDALDTAVEQACDAHASKAVSDPLIVAQALLDTARLQAAHGEGHGCVAASLPARISALCAPPAAHRGVSATPLVALALLALAALVFDHEVHRAAELVAHFASP